MADKITKEQRSKNMKAIRSQSKLENRVSKALWKKGLRFRKNDKSLVGKPDISIKKYEIVIFVDSCFWHGCQKHCRYPQTNQDFWKEKITRNINRDKEVTNFYTNEGWHIYRIWEHDLKEDFDGTINLALKFINNVKINRRSLN